LKSADPLLDTIAEYVVTKKEFSPLTYQTASLCLADSLGCAIKSLSFPACKKLLGPVVANTNVPNGAHVPGTSFILDPILAAFNIGTMIRWLDFNDTWLAKEWGHPSDNLGALLALSDFLSRNGKAVLVKDLFNAMIKAYEIQGVLALENCFNAIGFDHVILVKIASAALSASLLGANKAQVVDTLSHAFIDTGPLRTYRHFPCTGSRKSWAAGDATRRGLELAYLVMRGEMGYPLALSSKRWGFQDVLFQGKELILDRSLDSYVMENILFKVQFAAEFHAQTAVEAAILLKKAIDPKDIVSIEIATHAACLKIIDKKGPLKNPADRDHCLQYMVAIALLYGTLSADHYEDVIAQDPRIDSLREKMVVIEDRRYSDDYLDPNKRSIASRVTVTLKGGKTVGPIEVQYPLGHRKRREESIPLIFAKQQENLKDHYPNKAHFFIELFQDQDKLEALRVDQLVNLFSQI
jgi:2-methylcitrate dehydratase